MADKANRLPDNVKGAWYVDAECIDCDLCREVAPENFERNEDEGHSYVHKQPETDEERALCEEARDSCPVEAIGDDASGDEGSNDVASGDDASGDDASGVDAEDPAGR